MGTGFRVVIRDIREYSPRDRANPNEAVLSRWGEAKDKEKSKPLPLAVTCGNAVPPIRRTDQPSCQSSHRRGRMADAYPLFRAKLEQYRAFAIDEPGM